MLYRKKDDDSLVILKEINLLELSKAERTAAMNEVRTLGLGLACLELTNQLQSSLRREVKLQQQFFVFGLLNAPPCRCCFLV